MKLLALEKPISVTEARDVQLFQVYLEQLTMEQQGFATVK
jgi:hypothetical protein